MKTIIIATDFSTSALNAANYAIKFAEFVKADILLFNVYEVLANYGEMVLDVNVENLTKSAANDLEKLKNELLENSASTVNIKTEVRMGVFFDELEKICDEINPFALIMGSQGKSAVERFFFGGHVLNVIRKLSWPIIAVPPNALFNEIRKIGIAYDFENPIDDTIIEKIKIVALEFNAEIHILNYGKIDSFGAGYGLASEKLQKSFIPFDLKFHFIASTKNDDGIVDFIDNNNINLLIIMPKLHSFIDKLLFKSHSKELVLNNHVPILSLSK